MPCKISQSLVRRTVATLLVAVVFVFLYETTIRDSRYAARQATVAEATGLPQAGAQLAFTATAYCKGETTASGVVVRTGHRRRRPGAAAGRHRRAGGHAQLALQRHLDGMDTGPAVQGRADRSLSLELPRGPGLRPAPGPPHGAPPRVEPADERAQPHRPGPAAAGSGRRPGRHRPCLPQMDRSEIVMRPAAEVARHEPAVTLVSSPLMHALYVVVPVLGILAIAYRYYSAFIATRIWMLDDSRVTPAHTNYDGANYYPTSRWVLFGHHFAAITGAGPLVGPMLAAQFGYAPGLIWLVAGVVPRRRRARLDDPVGLHAPRRALAGRNRQGGDQPARRASSPRSPSSSSSSSPSPASASTSSTRSPTAAGARSPSP